MKLRTAQTLTYAPNELTTETCILVKQILLSFSVRKGGVTVDLWFSDVMNSSVKLPTYNVGLVTVCFILEIMSLGRAFD